MAGGKFSEANLFGMTIRESANDGSDFTNPDADYRRLFLGEDGKLHVKDSSGTVTDPYASSGAVATDSLWDAAGDLAVGTGANTAAKLTLGTTGQAVVSNGTTAVWGRPKGTMVDFAKGIRTGGDVTCSADQIWADFDTGLDMTLDAATSDIVEVGLSVGASSTDNVHIYFTFMTIVSASPVNDVATGTSPSNSTLGVPAWQLLASAVTKGGGSIMYTLQSGDITGGTVVLRLRYRTSANTDRVVAANSNRPVHVWAKNLGPAI